MANYNFQHLNSGINILNPKTKTLNTSYGNGVANIEVGLSVANAPQGQAPDFSVTFEGMPYVGDEPLKADIDAFVAAELLKHKV